MGASGSREYADNRLDSESVGEDSGGTIRTGCACGSGALATASLGIAMEPPRGGIERGGELMLDAPDGGAAGFDADEPTGFLGMLLPPLVLSFARDDFRGGRGN